MAFPKKITLTTPPGRASWPKLNDPDYGNPKFPKPDGVYTINHVLTKDDPAVQKFLAKLQPHWNASEAAAKEAFKELKVAARKQLQEKNGPTGLIANRLFKPIYDEETEEETGEIEMKFSMKASGVSKKSGKPWSRKPVIVDGRGNILAKPPAIWGGSIGIVSFEFTEGGYFIPGTGAYGLSFNLAGYQILELHSGGGRSASSLGFGAQDGAYEHKASEDEDTDEDDLDGNSNGEAAGAQGDDTDF